MQTEIDSGIKYDYTFEAQAGEAGAHFARIELER